MGPREKPQVLSRGHINPEPSIQILNFQVPLWDHIDLEPSIWILNSARATQLFRGIDLYNEGPLWGLPLPLQQQIDNVISANLIISCEP